MAKEQIQRQRQHMFSIHFKGIKRILLRTEKKGFSLIEVLIALAIFSAIVVTLYSTFWSGIKIDQRLEDKTYRQASWALEEMAKEFENAVKYDFSNSYPDINEFSGEKDRASFLLPTDQGLKVIQYYLEQPEEVFVHKVIIGKRSKKNVSVTESRQDASVQEILVREECSLVDFINGTKADSLKEAVCFNVEEQGLEFLYAYLEASEDDSKLDWQDNWKNNYIPAGIKVNLKLVGQKERDVLIVRRSIYIPAGRWGEEESL
ncbi:MAG: prepilin-type N-terminal cleavage/methylation domain-containing protein [Candidatus Omnitrophica bacterium]|nr:prepilin-type N-terminal cleavage/methylation domain-containing protein [Candidatus Omnitrophota bacterium]